MKLIFEYEEQTTGHVCGVDDNQKEGGEGVLTGLPEDLIRKELPLPNVSEINVVRHYTNMSRKNFGIDLGFYPLGSCTMKVQPEDK